MPPAETTSHPPRTASIGDDATARRDFLASLCAGLAMLAIPDAQASTAPARSDAVAAFMKAAAVLTGLPVDDREQAARYLAVLRDRLAPTQVEALIRAAALPPEKLLAASRTGPLREAGAFAMDLWLTGMAAPAAPNQPAQVLAYTDALVWAALPFTKPPGYCGGAFGYWADPPAPA